MASPSASSSSSSSSSLAFHIIGDAFVDLFCFVEGILPELGGDSRLSDPVRAMAGGSATNSATHLMALIRDFTLDTHDTEENNNSSTSKSVELHTTINPNDEYGKLMLNHAAEHGYRFSNCNQDQSSAAQAPATGHCLVVVCQGDRTFMTHTGCVDDFEASHVNFEAIMESLFFVKSTTDSATANSKNNLPQPSHENHIHVHVAGYYNITGFWNGKLQEKLEYLRNEYQQRSLSNDPSTITVSLIPQFDYTGVWDGGLRQILPLLDFCIMNEVEAQRISGASTPSTKDGDDDYDDDDVSTKEQYQQWADFFHQHCPQTWVIVTQGKNGAIAIRHGSIVLQQTTVSLPDEAVVDPTGAGDAFLSGFLHGIWSWRQNNGTTTTTASAVASKEPLSDTGNIATTSSEMWPVDAIQHGLQWGCAVGTCCVMTRGASVPSSASDIQHHLQQIRIKDL